MSPADADGAALLHARADDLVRVSEQRRRELGARAPALRVRLHPVPRLLSGFLRFRIVAGYLLRRSLSVPVRVPLPQICDVVGHVDHFVACFTGGFKFELRGGAAV